MSPCLLLLKGATGTCCLSQPHWPKVSGPQSCQLMDYNVLAFTISWVSQLILASMENSEVTKPLQISHIPSFICTPYSKWEWRERERETDKRHKMVELQQLQHKRLTLAFLPLREDDNDFSEKAMLYQLWWAKGANSLKCLCHLGSLSLT